MIASVATTRTLVLQRSAACSHQRQPIQRGSIVYCLLSTSLAWRTRIMRVCFEL